MAEKLKSKTKEKIKTVHIKEVVAITTDGADFLILKKQWSKNLVGWQFPQGGIENNETAEQAVRREVKEETGLDAKKIIELPSRGEYWYMGRHGSEKGKRIHKIEKFFLALVNKAPAKLSKEHVDFMWADKDKALSNIKYNKEIFSDSLEYLTKLKEDK